MDKVIKKFVPRAKGEEAAVPCLIEHNQKAIGYIQYFLIEPAGYESENGGV